MATMQEVADRANVSIATVSFVVNNTKPVAPETRERIMAAIDELGFKRNAAARALASRRTRILALLFPLVERNLSDFVSGAADAAAEHGYTLVIWPVNNDASDAVTSLIDGGNADGVLLMEVQLDDKRVDQLVAARAPFVLIGRTRDPSRLNYVDIDFETTTRTALEHLVTLGHRDVALILEEFDDTPLVGYSPPVRAEQTFLERAAQLGVEPHVFRCRRDPGAGRRLAKQLFDAAPDTTGIILMNEDASFGLISGMTHLGLRIPDDVSVLSIATSEKMGAFSDPVLSTMNAPGSELGRLAANALVAQLDGTADDPTQIMIPCELHVAESTGPAPSARVRRDPV
jgi:DNA-binding LacI/PurR family transcriptional regulator